MTQKDRDELSLTQKARGRRVTHKEAAASVQRLINSHFHNPDSARIRIPADPSDDDLVIIDYIAEQATDNQRMREVLAHASNALYSGNLHDRIVTRSEIESFLAEPKEQV